MTHAPARLPPALAPWADALAVFPPDLALSLGTWLERLSLALGPWRRPAAAGLGEPDGYAGLDRRGSFDRLVPGEWLLAADLPDEFVRRAAMGELGYFALQREAPAGGRRSVALFDAGPRQLGAPRIAQLALLIVLARRARAAGATFAWGLLQRPDEGLTEGASAAAILRLVETRVASDATPRETEAWQLALLGAAGADDPRRADDLWLIGAPGLSQRAHHLATSLVEVADVLEPGRRQVALHVMRWRAERHHVVLDLPDPDHCARLLRNPLEAPPAAVVGQGPDPEASLLFAPNGRRLATRLPDGAPVVYAVGRGGPQRGRRRDLESDETLVGLGWAKKRLVLATHRPGTLIFRGVRDPNAIGWVDLEVPLPDELDFTPPSDAAALAPCAMVSGDEPRGPLLYVVDGARRLYEIVARDRSLRPLGVVVEDVAWGHWGIAFLFRGGPDESGPNVLTVSGRGHVSRHTWSVRWAPGARAVLGYGVRAETTLVALEVGHGVWKLAHEGLHDVQVDPAVTVVGLISLFGPTPHVVLLEPDGRTFRLLGNSRHDWSVRAPDRVASAVVNHEARRLACVTWHGQILAWNLDDGAEVLNVLPEGGAP